MGAALPFAFKPAGAILVPGPDWPVGQENARPLKRRSRGTECKCWCFCDSRPLHVIELVSPFNRLNFVLLAYDRRPQTVEIRSVYCIWRKRMLPISNRVFW